MEEYVDWRPWIWTLTCYKISWLVFLIWDEWEIDGCYNCKSRIPFLEVREEWIEILQKDRDLIIATTIFFFHNLPQSFSGSRLVNQQLLFPGDHRIVQKRRLKRIRASLCNNAYAAAGLSARAELWQWGCMLKTVEPSGGKITPFVKIGVLGRC